MVESCVRASLITERGVAFTRPRRCHCHARLSSHSRFLPRSTAISPRWCSTSSARLSDVSPPQPPQLLYNVSFHTSSSSISSSSLPPPLSTTASSVLFAHEECAHEVAFLGPFRFGQFSAKKSRHHVVLLRPDLFRLHQIHLT